MYIVTTHIIELSILSALLSLMLEFCMRKGNILGWWLDWIADVWLGKRVAMRYNSMSDDEVFKLTHGKYDNARDWKLANVDFWLFKPLGYCVVCMNAWIAFGIGMFKDAGIGGTVVVVLLSSFLIRYFHDKLL